MKFSYVFMTQKGRLETEAMLLAASIRMETDDPIVVGHPIPYQTYGNISSETRKFLKSINTRLVPCWHPVVNHPRQWNDGHGWTGAMNKLSVMPHAAIAEKIAYLDSDTVVLEDFKESETLTSNSITTCPMGFIDRIEQYEKFLGLGLTANGGTLIAPAGVWGSLISTWAYNCQVGLDNNWVEQYDIKPHHLDQLCLTRTIRQHEYANKMTQVSFSNPYFVHWFELRMLKQNKPAMHKIECVLDRWPELKTIGPDTKLKQFLNKHFAGV